MINFSRAWLLAVAIGGVLATPGRVFAQADTWQVDVAPLYFWASELDGRLAVNSKNVPLFMPFDNALDKLAGAFALHVDARRGRWGALSDVNFIRLSTDTSFTTPGLARPVVASAQFDMVLFEAGVSYAVAPARNFSVIGGVRTYTMSPTLSFAGTITEVSPVDTSATAVSAFGGFTFRPKLSDKVSLVSRADIGGGEAFTWSGTLGVEYRFKPWAGVMAGYHALGTDTGNVPTNGTSLVKNLAYDVTQYGPTLSLTFHWAQK